MVAERVRARTKHRNLFLVGSWISSTLNTRTDVPNRLGPKNMKEQNNMCLEAAKGALSLVERCNQCQSSLPSKNVRPLFAGS